MKPYFLFLLLVAVIFETISDTLFKLWTINSKDLFFWIGMAIYMVGTLVWAYSLKFGFLSKAISIFTVLNFILVILVGVIFLKENLSLVNKVGIMLGIISVVLMQI
jgi:multidrug transporter EmrE-like cation transporter